MIELLAPSAAIIAVVTVVAAAWYAYRARARNDSADRALGAMESAAEAWKHERDAEVAHRERAVADREDAQKRLAILEVELAGLRKATDVSAMAKQAQDEHREIVAVLRDMKHEIKGLSSALNMLLKHLFPTAVVPLPGDPEPPSS